MVSVSSSTRHTFRVRARHGEIVSKKNIKKSQENPRYRQSQPNPIYSFLTLVFPGADPAATLFNFSSSDFASS